jgi:hypothetical protein
MGQRCSTACDKACIDARYDPHHPEFWPESSKPQTATPEPSVAKTEPSLKTKSEASPVAAPEPTPANPKRTAQCMPALSLPCLG